MEKTGGKAEVVSMTECEGLWMLRERVCVCYVDWQVAEEFRESSSTSSLVSLPLSPHTFSLLMHVLFSNSLLDRRSWHEHSVLPAPFPLSHPLSTPSSPFSSPFLLSWRWQLWHSSGHLHPLHLHTLHLHPLHHKKERRSTPSLFNGESCVGGLFLLELQQQPRQQSIFILLW